MPTESAIAQTRTQRKKVAIVDFDFANTSDPSYWYAYRGGGAARGMSELLINKLVNDGTFIVTSRSALENYLRDKRITHATIDEATAVKIGQALGVDVVIVGTVTRFNVETRRAGGSFMGFGGGSEKTKAVVQLTARMIDTKSQNIIAAMDGLGEAERSGGHGAIAGYGSGSSSGSGTDEILSQAADNAVIKLVSQMKTRL
ncbi:MAG: penicillin-binding protein activator LpoB [Leptolyngbyaceae cyanobacterium RU_5_1]|nr:penicillin-binding protein activator LpoB [Leptolyngbyaceae cyanobacterium RU_5_1]